MIEKQVLAQSLAIHDSNESFHFKNSNLLDVCLKQFCFEFLIILKGFDLSLGKKMIWSGKGIWLGYLLFLWV